MWYSTTKTAVRWSVSFSINTKTKLHITGIEPCSSNKCHKHWNKQFYYPEKSMDSLQSFSCSAGATTSNVDIENHNIIEYESDNTSKSTDSDHSESENMDIDQSGVIMTLVKCTWGVSASRPAQCEHGRDNKRREGIQQQNPGNVAHVCRREVAVGKGMRRVYVFVNNRRNPVATQKKIWKGDTIDLNNFLSMRLKVVNIEWMAILPILIL